MNRHEFARLVITNVLENTICAKNNLHVCDIQDYSRCIEDVLDALNQYEGVEET